MGEVKKIAVVDFGGQYGELIARRIRQCHVYSVILPCTSPMSAFIDPSIEGFIFTGGPASAYDSRSPHIDPQIFALNKPILGICYGAQIIAEELGGSVTSSTVGEYGKTEISITANSPLFFDVPASTDVFMSHRDKVVALPNGFHTTSHSENCENASFENEERKIYGTQFHPEVIHTSEGQKIIENFVLRIAKMAPTWKSESFVKTKIEEIRKKADGKDVICALSGGVDSSVTAALVSKAIGKHLHCIFVDHGLLRKGEAEQVKETFGAHGHFDLDFTAVDASQLFLKRLRGVSDPERKRKIIGASFIDVFARESRRFPQALYLAQGTIYPDRIESGLGLSAKIKSHHNVGGLPKDIQFSGLIEPLADLFKDEVREVGRELGLPDAIVDRQPFPGPGLAIRIVGPITKAKIHIVQEADAIFREEVAKAGLNTQISQYFAALTNMRSVGVMGDERSYEYAVTLRAVTTEDFMTAKPYPLPYDLLGVIADRIVDEVKGVNRVLYDFTSKPPSTIELE